MTIEQIDREQVQIGFSPLNQAQSHPVPPESIGKRIAKLRLTNGWTQQSLASRLAISRVAVSHIEMDLTIPSERTITLLAGLFKLNPHELVAGTTYPIAKSERLPTHACCYTRLELDLKLLGNDLKWLGRISPSPERSRLAHELREIWTTRLSDWSLQTFETREKDAITSAQQELVVACNQA
jgi:transcriptional regulator with XRE-family HTH domain